MPYSGALFLEDVVVRVLHLTMRSCEILIGVCDVMLSEIAHDLRLDHIV